ncbi:MAG: hypothetical protein IKV57_05590 [Clostridia bacterium]|nr:hypothetical protein [Clostridia bacterium]
MGFGLLILGYFLTFAFNISQAYFFADVIGALILLYAFTKLSEYNLHFRSAAVAGVVFTLLAMTGGVLVSLHMLTTEGIFDILLDCAKSASALVMHIYMFLGTKGIAQGADCMGLAEKAMRNLVLTVTYYVLYFLTVLLSPAVPALVSYVSFLVYLYFLVCLVLNILLFHTCFGMLYPAEGDPMENRRSKIPLFNKISDAFDRVEEKKNAFRRESMQMAMEEAEKRAAEKAKQHGSKKKKKKKK